MEEAELWPAPARRRRWLQLTNLLKPQPGERILDVGCGRGQAVVFLAQRVGPQGRVIGVDIQVSANLVAESVLTEQDLERWRSDLAERAAQGEYLYAINLYVCFGYK